MLKLIRNVTLTSGLIFGYSLSFAQIDNDVVAMAERLCKTKGSSTDIKVRIDGSAATGKVLAQIVGADGRITGSGEFTRSEWDGVKFTNSPEAYIKCLELVLPRIKKNV
jgi:hypothetical protein